MDQYAVVGNPVKHSKSPIIHRIFAEQTDQAMVYTAILAKENDFLEKVETFRANDGKGLNITLPFKQRAFELADELTERAARAMAVNTLVFRPDGSIRGDNTDGIGLTRDILNNHDGILANKRVLVVGAGGAVRGVLAPLLNENPALLVIANRTFEKARQLAEDFSSLGKTEAQPIAAAHEKPYDWVINGTSASLKGELPALSSTVIGKYTRSYDMMYGSQITPFNLWARDQGAATVCDGLGMLVEQAAESFRIWRGVMPATGPVIIRLRK